MNDRETWRTPDGWAEYNRLKRIERLAGEVLPFVLQFAAGEMADKARELQAEIQKGVK